VSEAHRLKVILAIAFRAFALVTIVATLASCGGGGSAPPSTQASAQVRFVNAATDLGDVEFEIDALKVRLAPRQNSDIFSVASGAAVVRYTIGGTASTTNVPLVEGRTRVIALKNTPIGPLVTATELDRKFGRVVYESASKGFPAVDVYLLSPGSTVAASSPTFAGAVWNSSAFVPIQGGTYVVAITPAGKKTVLFESKPTEFPAGVDSLILGAPAGKGVRTPGPILLTASDVSVLEDSRPAVRILKSGTPDSFYANPWALSIDGDLLAVVPDAIGETYHVSRGSHTFSMVTPDGTVSYTRQDFFVGADSLFQRFGLFGYVLGHPGGFASALNAWLAPEAGGGPPSAGRARVTITLSNCCRGTDLRVNGQLFSANVMNGTWILDPEPSNLLIELSLPGSGVSEGSRLLSVLPGHNYIVNIYDPVGSDGYAAVYANPAIAVQRVFNVAND
jgi:hypothetical protein